MSAVPKSWVLCTIADITTPVETVDVNGVAEREISYVDIGSINNKTNVIHEPKHYCLSNAPSRARQIIKSGDVLFSTVRPYLRNIARVQASLDGQIASTGFAVLRAARGVDHGYLFYKAISNSFVSALSGEQYGVSYPAVRDEQVRAQPVELPPTREQRRIVAKIEELFSELDKGVEALTAAREQLKAYRQSVLKHAFEGKLTEDWRKLHGENSQGAEELLKAILTTKSMEGKASKSRAISKAVSSCMSKNTPLPQGWRWTFVCEFADLVTDGTHFTPTYTRNGVPFISVKDIYSGTVHFNDCKYISQSEHEALSQRCRPEPGDLLITKSGTIGRLAIVPNVEFSLFVSVALIKIQNAKEQISPQWLRYVFEHHVMGLNIDQDIKGGLLKNYHLEDLRAAQIPLCGYEEQVALAKRIDEVLEIEGRFERAIDEALICAAALRQSILKQAFSGQLVAQDPTDEPASVLLERIRAERESISAKKPGRKTKKIRKAKDSAQ